MLNFFYYILNLFTRNIIRWVIHPEFYSSLFLLLLSTVIFLFSANAYKKVIANRNYVETVCNITKNLSYNVEPEKDCKIVTYNFITKKYTYFPCRSKVCYRYEVTYHANQQLYTSIARYNSSKEVCIGGELNSYLVGQNYLCWFNPNNPKDVLIDRRQSTLLPVIMILSIILMAWLTYKNLFSITYSNSNIKKIIPAKQTFTSDTIILLFNFIFGGLISFLFTLLILAIIVLILYIPSKVWNIIYYRHQFIQTQCTVIDKKLQEDDMELESKNYMPILLLKYSVKDINYFTWISPLSASSDKNRQEQFLQNYPYGKTMTCWYNPYQPRELILNRNFFFNLFH